MLLLLGLLLSLFSTLTSCDGGDPTLRTKEELVANMDAEKDPAMKRSIDNVLNRELEQLQKETGSLFSFSIPSARARAALEEYAQGR